MTLIEEILKDGTLEEESDPPASQDSQEGFWQVRGDGIVEWVQYKELPA
jgi:hypothetical protein